MTRITTDEEANAGAPGARAGGVFASPFTSKLENGPSKLRSIRCANDQRRPSAEGLWRMAGGRWQMGALRQEMEIGERRLG